jgi:hypothetical protein
VRIQMNMPMTNKREPTRPNTTPMINSVDIKILLDG